MNPEQRVGATRHVLLRTSSFNSVVSEPDASALCYVERIYPQSGKEKHAVTVFQPAAVSVFIPSPGQGLHVGQRLLDEEIPVVQHFYL